MHRIRIALLALCLASPLPLFAADQCAAALKGDAPRVKLTTSMGAIVIQLDKAKAPVSTDNFVKYVESGHYNATVFHRVMDNFMIQGGGFSKDLQQKPTQPPIKIESANGLKNEAYTVAMARTSDPNSATSQFFINTVDNAMLDYANDFKPGYAVFGKVVEGKETVDKIRKVKVQPTNVSEAQPLEPVVLEKAECLVPGAKPAAAPKK
jgi:peptidyl-prolyl cis-trans isomerase A (cyclophilin A)